MADRTRSTCALALALTLLGVSDVRAQGYQNPNLPRSPYALPQPTYREPDPEDVLNGNGRLHASGQWRHWGDDRNMGETFKELFVPDDVVRESPRLLGSARREQYCDDHPGVC